MSQFDFGNLSSPLSGADLIDAYLEPWRDALHSGHSGTSRPSYAVAGMLWYDTSGAPTAILAKYFDGADDITIGTINATANTFTPAVGTLTLAAFAAGAIADTSTATTQSQRDASTKLATDEYVDREASGIPINSQSVDYTGVLGDAGKCLLQTGASKTFTIPANASVAYPVGTTLMFECTNASGVSIAITSDTLNSTLGTGTRTLAQYGQAFAHKTTSTMWIINGSGLS